MHNHIKSETLLKKERKVMFAIYANEKEEKEVSNRKLASYSIDDPISLALLRCGIEQHGEYVKHKVDRIKRISGCKIQDQNFMINF